jgi:hypothetical protein
MSEESPVGPTSNYSRMLESEHYLWGWAFTMLSSVNARLKKAQYCGPARAEDRCACEPEGHAHDLIGMKVCETMLAFWFATLLLRW